MSLTRIAGRAGPVAVIVLVGCCLVTGPVSAAPAPDKQQQAQDLEQQIEDQGQRVAMLDEQFNQAQVRAEALGAELASMGPRIAESDRQLAAARQRLSAISIDSYVRGGSAPLIGALIKSTSEDFGVRRTYVRSALDGQKDALKQFDAARRRLLTLRDELRVTERSARATLTAIEANRQAAQATISSQQVALAQAQQSDLAPLVAQASAARAQKDEQQGVARFNQLAAAPATPDPAQPRRASGSGGPSTTLARPSGGPAPAPAIHPTTTVAHSGSTPTTMAPAPTPTGPIPAVKSGASAAVNTAKAQLGKPYVYGGAGPDNYDCSGLTMYAWRAGGVGLPHSAQMQYDAIAHIPLSALAPGDLVFFGSPIYHVGIYVGGGQMIEAPHTGAVVRYASIYRPDLFGAGRP